MLAAINANGTKAALAARNAGVETNFPHDNAARPLSGLQTHSKDAGPSPLAQAVQNDNLVRVKALLDQDATDVNGLVRSLKDRDSPEEPIPLLAAAAEAGNREICQALVAHGADVNLGGSRCALKMAAMRGRSEVIRFLFQHGATLDPPDGISDDYSLMQAARSGDDASVRLLLTHGADAKYVGRWGSVLSDAVLGGNLAVIKRVVEAGADVNGGGAYTNVLQDAAEAGNVEIVRYLLKKGAEVNGEFRWNRTPLLEAVKAGHTAVVKLLLEHGADWRPQEEAGGMGFTQGDTAFRLAQRTGNKEIVQMLRKAGAKE